MAKYDHDDLKIKMYANNAPDYRIDPASRYYHMDGGMVTPEANTKYTFEEPRYLEELREYVTKTYSQHYANGAIQVTEFIMSHLDTPDFLRGNVLKYTARYGKKGGYQRKDLLKAMHYLLLLLYFHDKKYETDANTEQLI